MSLQTKLGLYALGKKKRLERERGREDGNFNLAIELNTRSPISNVIYSKGTDNFCYAKQKTLSRSTILSTDRLVARRAMPDYNKISICDPSLLQSLLRAIHIRSISGIHRGLHLSLQNYYIFAQPARYSTSNMQLISW